MRGRPRKIIDPLNVAKVFGQLGATDSQLAIALGVKGPAVDRWKSRHPEIVKALKEAKQVADANVVKSLYQRACGYSHESVKIFKTSDDRTIEHKFIEHYPPDTAAAIFWLCNRQRDDWTSQHGDVQTVNINAQGIPDDLMSAMRAAVKARAKMQLEQKRAKARKALPVVTVEASQVNESPKA